MSLSVKASVDLHRFLLSFILCGYSVMMNAALCSPSQVHGVCVCVCGCVLKVDEGVVINNDISRTRSNHCSLSLSVSVLSPCAIFISLLSILPS